MPNAPRSYRGGKRKQAERQRGTSAERGYGSRWQKARKAYLAQHPLCVECKRQGKYEAARVVDHIVPHRGDEGRFWLESNWQALCVRHHNEKTARGE